MDSLSEQYRLQRNGPIRAQLDIGRDNLTLARPAFDATSAYLAFSPIGLGFMASRSHISLARVAKAGSGPAAPTSLGPGAASINEVLAFPGTTLQMQKELSLLANRQAAIVDRFLGSSNASVAQAYRTFQNVNPNFASLIRGRVLDRRIHLKLEQAFEGYNVRLDQVVPGSGNILRPDVYFPNIDGQSAIFDIGGPSKIFGIQKYRGMADQVIPIVP